MAMQGGGRAFFGAAVVAALAGGAAPAAAGEAETARLQGYVGTWGGTGVLRGEASIERFGCRLDVTRGNAGKINFRGNCTVRGAGLSVAGTVGYFDAQRHYEAALSSNTEFKGVAVGEARGNELIFALKDRDTDSKGNDLALKAEMVLQDRTIAIRFGAVLNGEPWEGEIGFRR